MAQANSGGSSSPIVIKKYANRRLYDTSASCYVTLENLAEMVRNDIEFVVKDARSGDDITRSVLAQIILDAESRGENVLPVNFLRQVIPQGVWLHDKQDGNGDAHLKAGLVGPSETVPIIEGKPGLSTWQNIFLCEFDGPRSDRQVVCTILGDD